MVKFFTTGEKVDMPMPAYRMTVDDAKALAAYRELRRQALQYRWYVEVQREAIGLRRHDVLDEFYRIPPPVESRVEPS